MITVLEDFVTGVDAEILRDVIAPPSETSGSPGSSCLSLPYDRLDNRDLAVIEIKETLNQLRLRVAEIVRRRLDLPRVEPEQTCLRSVHGCFEAGAGSAGDWWTVARAIVPIDVDVQASASSGVADVPARSLAILSDGTWSRPWRAVVAGDDRWTAVTIGLTDQLCKAEL